MILSNLAPQGGRFVILSENFGMVFAYGRNSLIFKQLQRLSPLFLYVLLLCHFVSLS